MSNEYFQSLENTANAVDELITDSANLHYFRSQIKRLCDLVERRAQAIKPLMERAHRYQNKEDTIRKNTEISRFYHVPQCERTTEQQERVDLIEQEQDKELKNACPGDGYILRTEPLSLGGYYKFEAGFRWWLPLEPPNPLVWFPGCEKYLSPVHRESELMMPDDERMRDAVILAVVHNWGCSSLHTKVKGRTVYSDLPYNGRFFERDKFLHDLRTHLISPDYIDFVTAALTRMSKSLEIIKKPKNPTDEPDEDTDEKDRQSGNKSSMNTRGPSAAEKRAWESYCWVCKNKPRIPSTLKAGCQYSEEMYKAAIEESNSYHDDEGNLIASPGYKSWTRNVRGYKQKAPNGQLSDNQSRSAVKPNQIQSPSEIAARYEPTAD